MTLCFVRCWRVIRSSGCVALQSKRNVCSCLMRLPHGIRNHSSDRMNISTNEISRGWDKFLCARGAIYFHNTQPIFQIRRLKSDPKMRPVFWSQNRVRNVGGLTVKPPPFRTRFYGQNTGSIFVPYPVADAACRLGLFSGSGCLPLLPKLIVNDIKFFGDSRLHACPYM